MITPTLSHTSCKDAGLIPIGVRRHNAQGESLLSRTNQSVRTDWENCAFRDQWEHFTKQIYTSMYFFTHVTPESLRTFQRHHYHQLCQNLPKSLEDLETMVHTLLSTDQHDLATGYNFRIRYGVWLNTTDFRFTLARTFQILSAYETEEKLDYVRGEPQQSFMWCPRGVVIAYRCQRKVFSKNGQPKGVYSANTRYHKDFMLLYVSHFV